MAYIKLGNLSPEEFARRVGAQFTDAELAELHAVRSGQAALTGPEDFHIFADPVISVSIGAADSRVAEIFQAANGREQFNRPVQFYLDRGWADK